MLGLVVIFLSSNRPSLHLVTTGMPSEPQVESLNRSAVEVEPELPEPQQDTCEGECYLHLWDVNLATWPGCSWVQWLLFCWDTLLLIVHIQLRSQFLMLHLEYDSIIFSFLMIYEWTMVQSAFWIQQRNIRLTVFIVSFINDTCQCLHCEIHLVYSLLWLILANG